MAIDAGENCDCLLQAIWNVRQSFETRRTICPLIFISPKFHVHSLSDPKSLIVLFRPLEVHVRITLAQRAKRAAREAARRATALRRAEAERLIYEARQRKRMAALSKAAEQNTMGQKHDIAHNALERNIVNTGKFDVQTTVNAHSGMGASENARLSVNYRGGRIGTVVSRTARGGRVIQLNPSGANQVVVPRADSARATGTSGGWLRNRSAARGKRAPSRRVVVYRYVLRNVFPLQ